MLIKLTTKHADYYNLIESVTNLERKWKFKLYLASHNSKSSLKQRAMQGRKNRLLSSVYRWRTGPEIDPPMTSAKDAKSSRRHQTKYGDHATSNGGPAGQMSSLSRDQLTAAIFDTSQRPDLCFHVGKKILCNNEKYYLCHLAPNMS